MEKKEVKFTERQKAILDGIQADKKVVQDEANEKFQRILQRENEIIVLICDGAGVEPVQGIELKGDHMLVPVPEAKEKTLKKSK